VPLLKILVETKSLDPIIIIHIASKFFGYVIDYIKYQQKIMDFKHLLDTNFDELTIKENLKYLLMSELIDRLYKPQKMINNKLVIYGIIGSINEPKVVLCDNTTMLISKIDVNNAVIEENSLNFIIQYSLKDVVLTCSIPKFYILRDVDGYYISLYQYWAYRLFNFNVLDHQFIK
jgi:hypothetical protein